MRAPLITVVSVNYKESVFFIDVMLSSLCKLTFSPFDVIICDNGSGKEDVQRLRNICKPYDNVRLIERQQSMPGSYGHGEALDVIIGMVNTKFTVVMDPDCTFLVKCWDSFLLNKLDDTTKIIGATSPPDRSGKRIGGGDFPLPSLTLFETEIYNNLNISCMPRNIDEGEDTGWQWKTKLLGHGYLSETLVTKNTRDFKNGPFSDLVGIEEYYTNGGDLIASHFGRGASGGSAQYLSGEHRRMQKWLQKLAPKAASLLARIEAKKEINQWKKTCYRIIDKQNNMTKL
jgi:glycosyltransferase involved in cell wall biosynthesis